MTALTVAARVVAVAVLTLAVIPSFSNLSGSGWSFRSVSCCSSWCPNSSDCPGDVPFIKWGLVDGWWCFVLYGFSSSLPVRSSPCAWMVSAVSRWCCDARNMSQARCRILARYRQMVSISSWEHAIAPSKFQLEKSYLCLGLPPGIHVAVHVISCLLSIPGSRYY